MSAVVQALPSLQDAVLFVLTQPVDGLHESFVHTLLSLQLGAGPPTQMPPAHVSAVVQALPSLQDAVLFVLTQPVDGLHESFVQTLPSLQLGAGPPTQVPPAHVSAVVQALPSLQDAVLFVLTQPVAGVARVVRADVAVVAVRRRAADAKAAGARVRRRARVAVVAGRRVVRVDAAGRRTARVVGADVAVVAVRRRAADAEAAGAGVGRRAGVPVVARGRVVRVDAARRRVARVVRADVAVVAVQRRAADAERRRRRCRPSCRRCRRCTTPCCSR